MLLKQQINQDFIEAMKAKDEAKKDVLKMVKAAIKDKEIDTKTELDDEQVQQVLRSELKKRNDAITLYKQGGRQDLLDKEQAEAEMISAYLPQMMSKEEVEKEVEKLLADTPDDANFGQVMGKCMGVLKGKADGKIVQEVIKEKLG